MLAPKLHPHFLTGASSSVLMKSPMVAGHLSMISVRMLNTTRSSNSTAQLKAPEMGSNVAGAVHFKRKPAPGSSPSSSEIEEVHSDHSLPHPIWELSEIEDIEQTHYPPKNFTDRAAYYSVQTLRQTFDTLSGYKFGRRDAKLWVRRLVFLETVAAVPGMVGGMVRHLNSLRNMERDHGWIHTLLEEAENERMHLMIALTLKQPGPLLRGLVLVSQGIFFWGYGLLYLLAPKFNHRFVGYLEEEAVKTYTNLLKCIDEGKVPEFTKEAAPFVARDYYQLGDNATLRDVFACMRADESHHRDVNHTFASANDNGSNYRNPFPPGH
ncbi:hypothetical protein FOL47_008012 [Perkinsus chesapeaki]|uniref:Alternative oxidase, mitochondrial n=1 Tax=Perkinsus chesapeaki TaxID=330153 RepID=A0A7J6LGE5_PERCH|nr:hypothetical protein FOL47_008012 [Perkinsus chesapeaki]